MSTSPVAPPAAPSRPTPDWRFVPEPGSGLLRIQPMPTDAELEAAYDDDYAPFSRPGISSRIRDWLEAREVRALWHWFAPPRRVLDVGCAGGELLSAVRANGNDDVHGIEPVPVAVAAAQARGLDVQQGFLEDADLPEGSVNTLVMSHVLEHVHDPRVTLRAAHRVLAPQGALLLWLPNADSIEAKVLGRYWIGWDPPRHLTAFSVRSLRALLAEHGFRVISVNHEMVGLEWAWGLRLWLRERVPRAEPLLRALHPALIVAGTPLALIGKLLRRSGRIRVIAVREDHAL